MSAKQTKTRSASILTTLTPHCKLPGITLATSAPCLENELSDDDDFGSDVIRRHRKPASRSSTDGHTIKSRTSSNKDLVLVRIPFRSAALTTENGTPVADIFHKKRDTHFQSLAGKQSDRLFYEASNEYARCFECSMTKAKCDRTLPRCGMCKKKNKSCYYTAKTPTCIRCTEKSKACSGDQPCRHCQNARDNPTCEYPPLPIPSSEVSCDTCLTGGQVCDMLFPECQNCSDALTQCVYHLPSGYEMRVAPNDDQVPPLPAQYYNGELDLELRDPLPSWPASMATWPGPSQGTDLAQELNILPTESQHEFRCPFGCLDRFSTLMEVTAHCEPASTASEPEQDVSPCPFIHRTACQFANQLDH